MAENQNITEIICELLGNGLPLVIASIIKHQGSSPRHTGAMMVIGKDGKSYGTIGGSLLEASTIREAMLAVECGKPRIMEFDLTNQNVFDAGMICGGKDTIMLDYVPANKEILDLFQRWLSSVIHDSGFSFLTLFRTESEKPGTPVIKHSLLSRDGQVIGDCPLSGTDLENIILKVRNFSETSIISLQDWQVLVVPGRKPKTLYCFGAGHVAKPTAHIAALTGFRVVVIDDRAEFSNIERFPDARETRVITDYSHALKGLDIDRDSFIVIITRGHKYDRLVLEQALQTKAGYIGMIGSRKKINTIYDALMATGVKVEELERVHAPVGLEIGAETPEEIAISIIAELISERSRQLK